VWQNGEDVTNLAQVVDGPFYRIVALPIPLPAPGEQRTAAGDWEMRITGSPGTAYQAAAILDEPQLDFDLQVPARVATGEPIDLRVRLSALGRPVVDAAVVARVFRPGAALATLVATTPLSAPTSIRPWSYRLLADRLQTRFVQPPRVTGTMKLQVLLQSPEFSARLKPTEHVIPLADYGDGSYSAQFTHTELTGNYAIVLDVSGNSPIAGRFQRTAKVSTVVRFGAPDLSRSLLEAAEKGRNHHGHFVELKLRPIDRDGNYLGADSAHKLAITLGQGGIVARIADLGDGTYVAGLILPTGADSDLAVRIDGKPLFTGKLSQLKSGGDFNWGLIFLLIVILLLFRFASYRLRT